MSNTANHLAIVKVDDSTSQTIDPEIRQSSHEKGCIEEIAHLHDEIYQQTMAILPKIMRVGELLVIQKQKLPHGYFNSWINENLPFSSRTAQNYMRVFRHKEQIENENISLLSDAYNILKIRRKKPEETGDGEEKRYFITFSLYKEEVEALQEALDKAKDQLRSDSNSKAISHIAYEWYMFPGNV
jgi:hypothetical protein